MFKKSMVCIILALMFAAALLPGTAPATAFTAAEVGDFPTISAGGSHTTVITNDGTLWTWGDNDTWALGYGTPRLLRDAPRAAFDTVAAVSAGGLCTMAIKRDGTLWAWGRNSSGYLGDTTEESKAYPVKIMDGVAAVSAGRSHTAAIKTDGTLWAWGFNIDGALGDGTTKTKFSPVKIMDGVAAVSAGSMHTAAIKTDGTLWTWGKNDFGQLGDGTGNDSNVPVKIMDGVAAVAVGDRTTFVIKTDGSLWGWGRNDSGQLGDGTNNHKSEPIKLMDGVAVVASGGDHTAVIKEDGSLWIWGRNNYSQVGDGTTGDKNSPVKIMDGVAAVSVGEWHTIALKTDSTLWAWGRNNHGELGDGTTENRSRPVKIMDGVMLPAEAKQKAPAFTFTDASTSNWFYDDVRIAWQMGLLNGKSPTSFAPGDNLTYAETVKLAACMHQLFNTYKVTLTNGSPNWYQSYVDYAKSNGIISRDYNWNAPTTRAEYIEIFANVFPDEGYAYKNLVQSNSIPDVPWNHPQADAIYKLYTAGILQGVDEARNCKPNDFIARSEVSAIVTRMMFEYRRVSFMLV